MTIRCMFSGINFVCMLHEGWMNIAAFGFGCLQGYYTIVAIWGKCVIFTG